MRTRKAKENWQTSHRGLSIFGRSVIIGVQAKKSEHPIRILRLVRVTGFEPAASWTPFKRDTKLRHTRMNHISDALAVSFDRIAHSDEKCKRYFKIFSKKYGKFSLTKAGWHGNITTAPETDLERCPSGLRNRSWKPAMWKHPWVRIPLSPPSFHGPKRIRSSTYAEVPKWPKGLPC